MRTIFFACFLSILLFGCSTEQQTKHVEYAVKNASGQRLEDVVVKIDSFHSFKHGVLIPGAHASFSGSMPLHPKNKIVISWRDSTGRPNEATQMIEEEQLSDKRICVFIIDKNMSVYVAWRFSKGD